MPKPNRPASLLPAAPARGASSRRPLRFIALALGGLVLGALSTTPALAQPGWGGWGGGWGGGGWGRDPWDGPMDRPSASRSRKDPREGRVQVSRFVRDDAAASILGHGSIKVVSEQKDGPQQDWVAPERRARFEAAVVDSLVSAGYDTLNVKGPDTQVASLTIRQRVLVPAEAKRNPVSGSAAMSVGTYGQSYGLAVNVDLTKPLPALISTRLDLRIRDKADGKVLWEGNAEIATYEGSDEGSDAAIATKLARALLDGFPDGQPVTVPVTEIGIPKSAETAHAAPDPTWADDPQSDDAQGDATPDDAQDTAQDTQSQAVSND